MKYSEKDIEFANQILTRRNELDNGQVETWMSDPESRGDFEGICCYPSGIRELEFQSREKPRRGYVYTKPLTEGKNVN